MKVPPSDPGSFTSPQRVRYAAAVKAAQADYRAAVKAINHEHNQRIAQAHIAFTVAVAPSLRELENANAYFEVEA